MGGSREGEGYVPSFFYTSKSSPLDISLLKFYEEENGLIDVVVLSLGLW
jgi:hypothetical protein